MVHSASRPMPAVRHADGCARARRSARCLMVRSILRSITHEPGSMTGYASLSFTGKTAASKRFRLMSLVCPLAGRSSSDHTSRRGCWSGRPSPARVKPLDAHRVTGHRDIITHLEVLQFGDDPVGVADVDAEPALDPIVGIGAAASWPHLYQPGPDRRRWRVDLDNPGRHDVRIRHQLVAGDLAAHLLCGGAPVQMPRAQGNGNTTPPPPPR